jgi:Tol biopolymer transport system component
MLLDLWTKKVNPAPPSPKSGAALSYVSPNKKWIVFTSNSKGSQQIFLRRANAGPVLPLTGGNCNSSSPAWELDSKAIVFASDCGRGIGLPTLYRAKLDQLENTP